MYKIIAHSNRNLRRAVLALALTGFASAQTAYADQVSLNPKPDVAIIEVEAPRKANLLQLRGVAGRGMALLRQRGVCHKMVIRLVAGDFGGKRGDIRQSGSILLAVTDPATIADLLAGRDLVSDMIKIGNPSDKGADAFMLAGLPAETGFVINPGRHILDDILGARVVPVTCDLIDGAEHRLQLQELY